MSRIGPTDEQWRLLAKRSGWQYDPYAPEVEAVYKDWAEFFKWKKSEKKANMRGFRKSILALKKENDKLLARKQQIEDYKKKYSTAISQVELNEDEM